MRSGSTYRWTIPKSTVTSLVASALTLALLVSIALFPRVETARADTVPYSGSLTTSSPTFHSPDTTDLPCTPVSTIFSATSLWFYHEQDFFVSASGSYTMANLSNTFVDPSSQNDSVLLLYSPSFDAANPLANLIAVNDDANFPTNTLAALTCPLNSGTNYALITTTFDSQITGSFSNQISGPGTVTLGTLPAATNTPTRTNTATNTPAANTATNTPTNTPAANTATNTPTNTPAANTATNTPTNTPGGATSTSSPTVTGTVTRSATPTGTVASTATRTLTPTSAAASPTPTRSSTPSPTIVPSVSQLLSALIAQVNALSQGPGGLPNGLTEPLPAALAAVERGNATAACNQVNAFENQVRAKSDQLGQSTVNGLLRQARQIESLLNC